MHELAFVDDIITAIKAKLKKTKKDLKVTKVNILIGELEHITPERFEFHFREYAKGTPFEKAELCFKKVEVRFMCKNCRYEFSSDIASEGCPHCRSHLSDTIKGTGISVESIEID